MLPQEPFLAVVFTQDEIRGSATGPGGQRVQLSSAGSAAMATEPGGGNVVHLAQAWKNGERGGSDFLPQWLRAALCTVSSVLKREERKLDAAVCRLTSLPSPAQFTHTCGALSKMLACLRSCP